MPDLKIDLNVLPIGPALEFLTAVVYAAVEDKKTWSDEKRALVDRLEVLLLKRVVAVAEQVLG